MGWNDYVCSLEIECQNCGEVSEWEFWDDVALARGYTRSFTGSANTIAHGKCRYCGSTRGISEDIEVAVDSIGTAGVARLQGALKKRAVTDDLKRRCTARTEKIEALLAATPIRGKQEQRGVHLSGALPDALTGR